MVCGLTIRSGLFCGAFMSPRLGPYVKYTFESWFLLFLTVELTKEDSCCALWNLCSGIFFDCWYPRDATEKGLQSKSLQPGRGAWPNATESSPQVFSKQGKGKNKKQNSTVTLGRHAQCAVLKKMSLTTTPDTETDATRQWYKQQHQNVIQLAAMSCGISFNCWTIGSDLTLFPEALSLWCASRSRLGWGVSACNIKYYDFTSNIILMSLLEQEDTCHSEAAFLLSHLNESPPLCFLAISPLPLFFFRVLSTLRHLFSHQLSTTTVPSRANMVSLMCITWSSAYTVMIVFVFASTRLISFLTINMQHCLLGHWYSFGSTVPNAETGE